MTPPAPPLRVPRHEPRVQRFPRSREGTRVGLGAGAPAGVVDAGPASTSPHRPIMLREVLRCLDVRPGHAVVDATLGGGGHAEALLRRIQPGGRLLGLDVDAVELPRTEQRLREAGFGPDTFTPQYGNFAGLPAAMAHAGLPAADAVLVDLGVSAMQLADAQRGFSYKSVGPLDLRLDPSSGEPASALLARLDEPAIAALLAQFADEPQAGLIAGALHRERPATTHALERTVRHAVTAARPDLQRGEVKLSVRRTLQALRIAVNGELTALAGLLAALPACLAPGGRVAILTFHSGEDRLVKKAFQAGQRTGVYGAVAREVIRSTKAETRADRRAMAAKLRWAVRAARPSR